MGNDAWKIDSLTVGPFATNHYLLKNVTAGKCWLFDCGFEEQRLVDWISASDCALQEILITHGHIDHVSAVNRVCQAFGVGYAMSSLDLPLTANLSIQGQMFGITVANPAPPGRDLIAGEFQLDDLTMLQLATPGHSSGGISFYFPTLGCAICGDVLFHNSIGRTDLPGGDYATLIDSIKNTLFALPDTTILFPGHMESTTVGAEKRNNPFVGGG